MSLVTPTKQEGKSVLTNRHLVTRARVVPLAPDQLSRQEGGHMLRTVQVARSRNGIVAFAMVVLLALGVPAQVFAAGGVVLPPAAKLHGYSLSEAAQATAV